MNMVIENCIVHISQRPEAIGSYHGLGNWLGSPDVLVCSFVFL